MDKIFIRELKIDMLIGTLPHEKTQKQPIIINLEIGTDIQKAARSEKIKDTVDYVRVTEEIKALIGEQHFFLLETLAEKISQHIFRQFKISSLKLEIIKPNAIANAKGAGIIIERSREIY